MNSGENGRGPRRSMPALRRVPKPAFKRVERFSVAAVTHRACPVSPPSDTSSETPREHPAHPRPRVPILPLACASSVALSGLCTTAFWFLAFSRRFHDERKVWSSAFRRPGVALPKCVAEVQGVSRRRSPRRLKAELHTFVAPPRWVAAEPKLPCDARTRSLAALATETSVG
jgi:hypothetical protein